MGMTTRHRQADHDGTYISAGGAAHLLGRERFRWLLHEGRLRPFWNVRGAEGVPLYSESLVRWLARQSAGGGRQVSPAVTQAMARVETLFTKVTGVKLS
jgi:hypothetical protein